MFTSEMIVAIFFRIINFAILIGFATYAFKKYGIPKLIILIAKKEAEYDSLLNRQLSLEESQFDFDKKIEKEARLCEQLKEKIGKWRTIVSADREVQKNRQFTRIEMLHKSMEQKMEKYRQDQIKDLVHGTLTIRLEKSLSHHFETAQNGHVYLEEIVRFMDKSTI